MTGRRAQKPELLVPAGSLENLQVAVAYGADAVYMGGEAFSLRAKAQNFSSEELQKGITYAREHGVRTYVTVNILAHDADLQEIRIYLKELQNLRPDGLIIADPGVFLLAKESCPDLPRHISTQANNTNSETCRFWHAQGASRIVAARELSLAELRNMRQKMPKDMELEVFVHGAMCISYSGRCLLSNVLNGRDANRGECTHPCRWKYALAEETRPGQFYPIEENERGTFLFNAKDLCMIEHIPELYDAGIDSLKIEGRMKTALYVATVTRAYRRAIDAYAEDPQRYREEQDWYRREVSSGTNRQFTTGFYFGKPSAEDQIFTSSTYHTEAVYLGRIRAFDAQGQAIVIQKNKFSTGEEIEILQPDGQTLSAKVMAIRNAEGDLQESAPHASQELHLELRAKDGAPLPLSVHNILRKRISI